MKKRKRPKTATQARNRELIWAYRYGDDSAILALAWENRGLGFEFALKIGYPIDEQGHDEIMACVRLAVARIAVAYDESKGTEVSTILRYYIRSAIQRWALPMSTVHIPDGVRSAPKKREKGTPEGDAYELAKDCRGAGVATADPDEFEFLDYVYSDDAPEYDDGPDESLVVRRALDVLSARERRIVELRYGLSGDDPKILSEIGEEFGISKERVRQIANRAVKAITAVFAGEGVAA
jgi:RNA polymerase sigma factor (sigma-70 family)